MSESYTPERADIRDMSTGGVENRRTNIAIAVIGLVLAGLVLVFVFSTQWQVLYDDAFISFRYAQNLVDGHGLTWNVGEAPTEGYSNLLFILGISPFMWLQWDPLLVARGLSFVALVVCAVCLYLVARRGFRSGIAGALVPSLVFVMMPASLILGLTGLETIPYTALLTGAIVMGSMLIVNGRLAHIVSFCTLAIACVLMRPDGALVIAVVVVVYAALAVRQRAPWRPLLLVVAILLTAAFALLLWKWLYFGQLLPNPFYIKSGSFGFDPRGLESIRQFISTYAVLVLCALAGSLLLARMPDDFKDAVRFRRTLATLCWLFILGTIAFFSTSATLMDIEGRFLFPLSALLLLLAIPLFDAFSRALTFSGIRIVGSVAASIMLFVLVSGMPVGGLASLLTPANALQVPAALTASRSLNEQWRLAEDLRRYSEITSTRIAFGDAGIVPYVTRAPWLDSVGLNDSFIARNSDLTTLTDYFFDEEPDLVFLGSDRAGGWFSGGHGPLGDFLTWSTDPRWDDYAYAGSVRRSDLPYDNVILVRTSSEKYESLMEFLRSQTVDGWYDSIPWDLGTHRGEPSASWVDGPRSRAPS
jgi:arabinofuranosyltransferase